MSSACKGRTRCILCGENKHMERITCPRKDQPVTCLNCRGGHLPTDSNCPTILKQMQIKALAATENITYLEAKHKLKNTSRRLDSFSDPRYDFVNFPNTLGNSSELQSSNSETRTDGPWRNRFSLLNSWNDEEQNVPRISYANITSRPNTNFNKPSPSRYKGKRLERTPTDRWPRNLKESSRNLNPAFERSKGQNMDQIKKT